MTGEEMAAPRSSVHAQTQAQAQAPVAASQEQLPMLMSALVTEHFVLQSMRGTITGESGSRSALYLASVSSGLVALGFVASSHAAFGPFAAAVLPAMLILGFFTFIRQCDIAVEDTRYLYEIQRIRRFYRNLSPDAARFFADAGDGKPDPLTGAMAFMGMKPGNRKALFTMASMVAAVNCVIAGAAVAVAAHGAGLGIAPAATLGVLVALGAYTTHMMWFLRRFARAMAMLAEPASGGVSEP